MKEQFKLRVSAKISRWNGDTYPLWEERAAEIELVPGAGREDELRAIELLCESMAKALKDVTEEEPEPVKEQKQEPVKELNSTSWSGLKTVPITQMEPVSPVQADALRQE